MVRVGGHIKRLREERGWSQPRLAVEAGVAVSAVSQIENGRRSPNVSTLDKLAEAFGVDVADFFLPKSQAQLPLEPEAAGLAAVEPHGKLAAAMVLEEVTRLWSEQLARGFYDVDTLAMMGATGFVLAANHEAEAREYRETLPPHFRAQLEAAEEQFAAIGAQLWALEEIDRTYPVPPDPTVRQEAKREEFLRRLRGGAQAQHA
jgi:transcriptional regulator with XRE-family HTH domain